MHESDYSLEELLVRRMGHSSAPLSLGVRSLVSKSGSETALKLAMWALVRLACWLVTAMERVLEQLKERTLVDQLVLC